MFTLRSELEVAPTFTWVGECCNLFFFSNRLPSRQQVSKVIFVCFYFTFFLKSISGDRYSRACTDCSESPFANKKLKHHWREALKNSHACVLDNAFDNSVPHYLDVFKNPKQIIELSQALQNARKVYDVACAAKHVF